MYRLPAQDTLAHMRPSLYYYSPIFVSSFLDLKSPVSLLFFSSNLTGKKRGWLLLLSHCVPSSFPLCFCAPLFLCPIVSRLGFAISALLLERWDRPARPIKTSAGIPFKATNHRAVVRGDRQQADFASWGRFDTWKGFIKKDIRNTCHNKQALRVANRD